MEQSGRWTVDFYDFTVSLPQVELDGLQDLGDVYERARRNGARPGTPMLVGPSGRPDPRVNLFFRTGAMAGAAASTWRRYAYALVVWLDFLEVFGRTWAEATVGDVEAFKDWRLTDVRNAGRVRPTSFDTDRAALNTFYCWAAARYGIANPVPTVRGGRKNVDRSSGAGLRLGGGGRDPLRPAGSARRQVKWMLRSAFEQWRDVGLRGYGFDGLRRSGWRGFNEDRDVAFVDGLYGTGLRLQEWSSVLDVELPTAGVERYPRAWLSAACAKGGRAGRWYRLPRTVLASIAGYVDVAEGSRAESIRRAQRAGRYEQLPGVRIVTGYEPRSRSLSVLGPGGPALVPVDVLGPDERRLLFRQTSAGLEPLAVWLSRSGLPKKAHGWEDTFADANRRVAAVWAATVGESAGSGAGCPLWARPHMARHSFALRWYSILSMVWQQRLAGFTGAELQDLRAQFGDIWFQLATLLGHADPATTRDYYLEPFTGLQVDYLMALVDDDERDGVEALVRAVSAGTGRTLTSVDADAITRGAAGGRW